MINREQLDDIIMKNDTNDWWQLGLFLKNTKHLLPSVLKILADPPEYDQNHNCFIYALGLQTNENILKETKGFIYDSFIKKLLEVGELIRSETPVAGDYVVYQDLENYPDALTHIGIIQPDKTIVSKWAWGPLVQHSLWDVPASYGNSVFYLEGVTPVYARELFEKYKKFNLKPINQDFS